MSHFRSENLKFSNVVYCLPSKGPFAPWIGREATIPPYVIPPDIPTLLSQSATEEFAKNPEQVLQQYLDSNPNFHNPRDIGRVLFHTPGISPYSNAVILFNSPFSSRALIFSFVTAIDLDCLSLTDAIRYITQRVAIPTHSVALTHLSTAFSHAYQLRNQLEWPNAKIVNDIFCAAVLFSFLHGDFKSAPEQFKSLKELSPSVLSFIADDFASNPVPLYFTSLPVNVPVEIKLEGDLEHEGRFRSSWNSYYYTKDDANLNCYNPGNHSKIVSQTPLEQVNAHQKIGVKQKPWAMQIQRLDGREFGLKMKDGVMKPSPRTSYTLAFKTEEDLMKWISAINNPSAIENMKMLN